MFKKNGWKVVCGSLGNLSNGCQDRLWTMYPPISISIIANFLFSHAMLVVDWRAERIIISDVICLISLNWLNWHKKLLCDCDWLESEFQTAVCYDERKYWLEQWRQISTFSIINSHSLITSRWIQSVVFLRIFFLVNWL